MNREHTTTPPEAHQVPEADPLPLLAAICDCTHTYTPRDLRGLYEPYLSAVRNLGTAANSGMQAASLWALLLEELRPLRNGSDFYMTVRRFSKYGEIGAFPSDWEAAEVDPTPEIREGLEEFWALGPGAPDLSRLAPEVNVPELPESARLPEDLGELACPWLESYTYYAGLVSPMTPESFHVSAGLFLGALAIARRLVVHMPFDDVYPNLFIAWLARTTLHRKSTALNVARGLAEDAMPFLLAAHESTPEAMIADMAGAEPAFFEKLSEADLADWKRERDHAAQRGIILDELSGLLASAGREYNAGQLEALMRFYDCVTKHRRSTRGQGRVTVRNAYLSILGASTPAAMAPHIQAEPLWANGWWPRFALLTPEGKRPDWQEPVEAERPDLLEHGLRRLYQRLPATEWPAEPEALSVSLGPGVFDAWKAYNKALSYDLLTDDLDQRLNGTYGRLPTQALKVATILAALSWPDDSHAPTIELPHLARAFEITECWRASTHRVLAGATASEYEAVLQRTLRQVARSEPQGATLRDIYRGMRDRRPGEVDDAVQQLLAVGELEVVEKQAGPKGGRPTTRYRLTRS